MIRKAIEMLVSGHSLSRVEASQVMVEIMSDEATAAQFGAFVTALRIKGETPNEIAGMAQIMRDMSLHVEIEGPLVDTCGTGGDGSGTFNISTTAGFVLAGADIKVAKHGNRAMSGSSGSADVLETLGVNIDLGPASVGRCLEEVGIGFMFAQRFHPAMRFAAGPRREINIPTVFNILGPLTNPAGVSAQLIGVADAGIAKKMAAVLGILGCTHALVVHGEDGLDEISLSGGTSVWELKEGTVRSYTIVPGDLGLDQNDGVSLRIRNVTDSADMIRAILDGLSGPARDVVLANSAGAMLAADRVKTLREGVSVAVESIDSGMARRKLELLAELSHKLQ